MCVCVTRIYFNASPYRLGLLIPKCIAASIKGAGAHRIHIMTDDIPRKITTASGDAKHRKGLAWTNDGSTSLKKRGGSITGMCKPRSKTPTTGKKTRNSKADDGTNKNSNNTAATANAAITATDTSVPEQQHDPDHEDVQELAQSIETALDDACTSLTASDFAATLDNNGDEPVTTREEDVTDAVIKEGEEEKHAPVVPILKGYDDLSSADRSKIDNWRLSCVSNVEKTHERLVRERASYEQWAHNKLLGIEIMEKQCASYIAGYIARSDDIIRRADIARLTKRKAASDSASRPTKPKKASRKSTDAEPGHPSVVATADEDDSEGDVSASDADALYNGIAGIGDDA